MKKTVIEDRVVMRGWVFEGFGHIIGVLAKIGFYLRNPMFPQRERRIRYRIPDDASMTLRWRELYSLRCAALIRVEDRSALVTYLAGFSVALVLADFWNRLSIGAYKQLMGVCS